MRLQIEPNVTTFPLVEGQGSQNGPGSYDIDALLKTGISAAQNGEREFARLSLTKVTELEPHCEDAWMWLASISEYPEELLALLDRVLDINSANQKALEWQAATKAMMARTFVRRAVAAREEGSMNVVIECLQQALEYDNNCETAWELKADLSEDENEKLACFERLLEINPENADVSRAIEEIRQRHVEAKFGDAKAAAAAGEVEKAREFIDEFLQNMPDNADAWMFKSGLCEDEDERLTCLERVLKINPDDLDAINAIHEIKRRRLDASFAEAKAAAVAGKRKKALELVDEFIRSVPDNAEAWILRSHLALDLEDKMQSLEAALAIDPENAAAKAGFEFLKSTFAAMTPTEAGPASQGESEHATPPEEQIAAVESTPEEQERSASDHTDAPVIEAVEIIAEDIPVVYDDQEQVEEAPIQPPTDEDFFAPIEARSSGDITTEEQPILAPTDEEIFQAIESIDPYATVAGPSSEEEEPATSPEQMASDFEQPFVDEVENSPEEFAADAGSSEVDEVESLPEQFVADAELPENGSGAEHSEPTAHASGVPCPYCKAASLPQSFECVDCNAVLSLSDIDSLMSNNRARRDLIQEAVGQMEAEWHLREFNEAELTALAIGHFNLRNFAAGFTYLQEASRLSPNNVILAGQVNAIQIRMDEMRRQEEMNEGKPKGKTILVVDDSPTVRKLISGKLEKSGHNVVCACDGVEALERLEEGLPDLVLLDIAMPRMDGYEVCRQIRSNPDAHDLPVVMISGKDGFFDKVRGRMAGTSGYVTKPFGPETLMKALETYLRPDVI